MLFIELNVFSGFIRNKGMLFNKLYGSMLTGVPKLYYLHYSYVVFVLLNTGLYKSAFSLEFDAIFFRLYSTYVILVFEGAGAL